MYVWGSSTATRAESTPGVPTRPSVSRPRYFGFGRDRAQRSTSSSATMNPTLWRVRAYSAPGLPSPTTSQSASGLTESETV